jgi:excisionase family DNA binding protein
MPRHIPVLPIPRYTLSVEQAAQALGICVDNLRKLYRGPAPKLQVIRVGRRVLIPEQAIGRFIERELTRSEERHE